MEENKMGNEFVPEMGNFDDGVAGEVAQFDDEQLHEIVVEEEEPIKKTRKTRKVVDENSLVCCLKNEVVILRHLPNNWMGVSKDHLLSDGMHERAKRVYTVPRLSSGMFVNVLTNKEKAYLEHIMQLEPGTMSVYKKGKDNFWSTANEDSINTVTLYKHDTRFNLSNPEDYIRVKILLANKDNICPSMQELQDRPKASYEYVVIRENEENVASRKKVSTTIQAYKEFGKIEDDKDKLRLAYETLVSKKVSPKTSLEWLQTQIGDLLGRHAKTFVSIVQDPLLDFKVTIRKGIDAGLIADRGGNLYIKESNEPMCGNGEEPTFNMAAKWLSKPKNQEVFLGLQAKIKSNKKL